ncbi:MAG TPA: peptidoglycan DD-metalloendopeptidase family protein [Gaiellaceae bacterium]
MALLLFVFLVWTPAAYAWSWPVRGPVVQPFTYDEAHPYAAGQHRGVDIGADATDETVVAPAAGTVSFAGTVPTSGRSLTIETADGYSVTLTHLGSIAVAKGATVAEQDAVGTVGPSGTPEVDGPYVHLGIRLTADPNGYVDPLGFLPSVPESSPAPSQPSTTATAPVAPASKPAPSVPSSPPVKTIRESPARPDRPHVSTHEHVRADTPRVDARPRSTARRPEVRDVHAPAETATRRPRVQRPLPEPAASVPLGAGHALRPPVSVAPPASVRRPAPAVLVPALCNGVPALAAIAAALMAARSRRRRRREEVSAAGAQVLRLPRLDRDRPSVSRAA